MRHEESPGVASAPAALDQLSFLSRSAMAFVRLPPNRDVFALIDDLLREIIPEGVFIINSAEPLHDTVRIRRVSGLGRITALAVRTLGYEPVGSRFTIDEHARAQLLTGRLIRVPGRLRELSFSHVPEVVRSLLERTFDVGDAYAVGFVWNGELYGSLSILLKRGQEMPAAQLIETFIHQAALALQRHQSEQALRASQISLRGIVDAIGDPVFVKDERHRFVEVNAAACLLVGRSREAMLGRTDEEFFPREQAALFWKTDSAVLESGKESVTEEAVTDGGGTPRTLITRKTRFTDEGGHHYIVAVSRDISDRKRGEDELRATNARLEALVEAIPDVVYFKDALGRNVVINRAYERLIGRPRSEILGRTDAELLPPKLAERCMQGDAEVRLAGERLQAEEMMPGRAKGETRCFETVKVPLFDAGGAYTGLVGVSRDISERRRLEQQLLQAHRMETVGRLAGGIAHDFNNILAALTAYATFVKDELPPDSSACDDIDAVLGAAERASKLTQQLLAFSRRQTIAPRPIDLNALIASLQTMMRPLVRENVQLEIIQAPEPVFAKVDVVQIEQVVLNLVVNAQDAMPDGGRLTVAVGVVTYDEAGGHAPPADLSPGSYAFVMVSDTGVGIRPEEMEHLFEPFFTTKPVGAGTGLGLATAYGIVKQHNGAITADSAPGRGSVFTVFLPRVEGDDGAETDLLVPTTAPVRRGSETILVVEDESTLRAAVTRSLRELGYRVLQADCGTEALALAARETTTIHLLLTDVMMPGMNGRELAESLCEMHPELRVLYMSGYSERVISDNGVLAEGMALLQKPFDLKDMACRVRELLDGTSSLEDRGPASP